MPPRTNTNNELNSITQLEIRKVCGPDCINNRVLKATAVTIIRPLTDLFNSSLRSSTVPDIWKKANVSPIHKKDDKCSVENYRPISLLIYCTPNGTQFFAFKILHEGFFTLKICMRIDIAKP